MSGGQVCYGPKRGLANTNTTTKTKTKTTIKMKTKTKTNHDKDLFCVGNVVTDGVQRIKG